MMGERTVMQEALFYELLASRIMCRRITCCGRSTGSSICRRSVEHLTPFYSATGRPSIDPELMIRMLIVGYCLGIRSERRLCEEVHLNLAYRWFCRLGLDGDVPDHSTFSKNRHGRFRDSDLLRKLFETTVERCMAEGLVGGEGFAVDASLIRADANRQRSVPGRRKVDWHATGRSRRVGAGVSRRARRCRLRRGEPGDAQVRSRRRSGGALDRARTKGHAFFAYATNYLIDLDHAVIVDVEATTRDPAGRGRRAAHDDRANAGALRPLARAARRRQRLWLGREARLAGRGARDRAAHPGVRQVRPQRRHLRARRLHLSTTRTTATSARRQDAGPVQPQLQMPRPASTTMASSAIAPASTTATPARSSRAAAPTRPRARSCARSTKAPATWPAISPRPTPISSHAASARRSRCCSLTSSAS